MRVRLTTELSCSAQAAWEEVLKPSLLLHVAAPWAIIRPVDGDHFPNRWEGGRTYQCRSALFGLIPAGTRTIRLERVDALQKEIQSRERDPLVRTWDHLISIWPLAANKSIYSDQVEIDAGPLTVFVWVWAVLFYRHRQKRWRRLALTL